MSDPSTNSGQAFIERAKLTEEEIRSAVVSPEHPWGIRLASFEYEFHAVADAATAKALWAVYDWMRDSYSSRTFYQLKVLLEQAGIERPRKEVSIES